MTVKTKLMEAAEEHFEAVDIPRGETLYFASALLEEEGIKKISGRLERARSRLEQTNDDLDRGEVIGLEYALWVLT